MPNVELTEREFFLLCVSVQKSKEDFQKYSDNSPHEEDAMFDNTVAVEYATLQEKFPSPDEGLYYLDSEGNVHKVEDDEEL